jgi:hypothetical protein
MSDQKNGNAKENDNVIQGPWPKSKRKVKLPDDEAIELQENIEFAEELTQTLIIQMIHTMGENNISVSSKSFIRDLGLIIELIKGSIYRSMGIPHPTHGFFEALVDVDIDEDDVIHSNIDLNLLVKFIETNKDLEDDNDDDPKVS